MRSLFFPLQYLGLPLSLTRLKAVDLQPILDKIADRLPGWKAALLDKSGQTYPCEGDPHGYPSIPAHRR